MGDRVSTRVSEDSIVPARASLAYLALIGADKKTGSIKSNDPDFPQLLQGRNERTPALQGNIRTDASPRSPRDLEKMRNEVDAFNSLLQTRERLESMLPDERAGELRRLRRDYFNAGNDLEKQRMRNNIDVAFPQMAGINTDLRAHAGTVSKLDTLMRSYKRDPLERNGRGEVNYPLRPALPPHMVSFDPYDWFRLEMSGKIESFYQPKLDDKFDAVWQKIKDESALVKANEVLKHLPPLKITFEKSGDIAKMIMIMAGAEPGARDKALLNDVFDGVTSIEKKEGGLVVLSRQGSKFIPAPTKVNVGAGITVKGIELGTISGQLRESDEPGLDKMEGICIRLDVPKAVARIGVHTEVCVRSISMEHAEDHGWRVFLTVDNPVPLTQRRALGLLIRDVPQEDRIKVPIITLDKDGKPR